ncbi:MAG: VIT1/CCC1 transporter family protein [Planctomycetota bacterium]|jgi:VIT1/CCC1 family predicted Fe2+/Mn2+ transporter|nr:VIT1/CCC1 transporter family protein [Planctomycetota bacterium]
MADKAPGVSRRTRRLLLDYQRGETTDYRIYRRMSERERRKQNQAILYRISEDEREHAGIWKSYTGREVGADRWKVCWYGLMSLLLGYTFVIKLMERNEHATGAAYRALALEIPEAETIVKREQAHEAELADMLDEERLDYIGAMVLGLNDALVELTGALAGLTFALGDNRLVALAGIIIGVSATLSMAASNYLAERADENENAIKSSLYTGAAYLATVFFLVLPYLLFPAGMYLRAFAVMLVVALLIIMFFNYYVSVAKSLPFFGRFTEMTGVSFSVIAVSFLIGLAAKRFLGIAV